MDEANFVLQVLGDELERVDEDIVGEVSRSDGSLVVLGGKLRLKAQTYHDPDAHPAVAHCHVTAEVGPQGEPLEACVVGVHADRREGLAAAAGAWMQLAAGPIFSLVHGRPVLDAMHFDGSEASGVPGAHGFAGPMGWRWLEREFDLEQFAESSLFDYAVELAPPRRQHIAKTTLTAGGAAGWTRNLEIDGHAAAHVDAPWAPHLAAPPQGVGVQFAVFHFADRPHWQEARRRLDDAIHRFVVAFQATQNTDEAANTLEREGVDAALVNDIAGLAPLAATRVVFATLTRFSHEFMRLKQDGSLEQGLVLMRQPVFARSMAIFGSMMGTDQMETVKNLALTGSELNAINNALHSGSKLEDLEMSPPVLLDSGANPDAAQAALEEMGARRNQRDRPPGAGKPWWRFW